MAKKSLAKEFLEGLNEKSDATTVKKPTEEESRKELDRTGDDIGNFDSQKTKAYLSNADNRRDESADLYHFRKEGSSADNFDKDRAEYYNQHLHEGEKPFDEYDAYIDRKKRNRGFKMDVKTITEINRAKEEQKAANKKKAAKFEQNLHKYDKKKSLVKSFFED